MSTIFRAVLWILILSWLAPGGAVAQIPNGGFENWSGVNPVGWGTSNDPMGTFINVSQSATAHGGSSAAYGVVVSVLGYAVQPVLQSGIDGEGFRYTQRATNFTGYYQFSPVGGDKFSINVALFKGGVSGEAVAVAAAVLTPTVSTYTQFSVPFLYVTASTPDTCVVQIMITGPVTGNDVHVGSSYLLDDIALSGAVGVEERRAPLPGTTKLQESYPNPFNPSTTIGYQLSEPGFVTLTVHDVLGREVAKLVQGVREAGSHAEVWDARRQASGVYFCRLTVGGYTETRKLVLAR